MVILHKYVSILKAIEVYTLDRWTLWCVNYVSITFFKKLIIAIIADTVKKMKRWDKLGENICKSHIW